MTASGWFGNTGSLVLVFAVLAVRIRPDPIPSKAIGNTTDNGLTVTVSGSVLPTFLQTVIL